MSNQIKEKKSDNMFVNFFRDRKLIFNLAKNDFKARFAGSYFGIIWAFVQPIITVFIYWFVFEKALNAGTQSTKAGIEAPYVLWLLAGLVPWFFFSEVISMGTNSLLEYNYLVKKVVFNIECLPLVKMISSLFVHLFFIAFMAIFYAIYGMFPGLIVLQLLYYTFAMMVLCMGIIYLTSAIVVFFRDLSQLVNIVLQVLMWATPIMWNIDAINIRPIFIDTLKFNPMYYIISGYRDTMLNGVWFWDRSMYEHYEFWGLTIFILALGTQVFRKLRPQFADVL